MYSFIYGGYRPHTPVEMLIGVIFAFFWLVDMHKGIIPGTAKLETRSTHKSLPRILVTTILVSLSVPLNPIMGQFLHSQTSTDRNKFYSLTKTYICIRVCIFDGTVSVCEPRFVQLKASNSDQDG